MKGIAGFSMLGRRLSLRTQPLYCKSSLVSALLGVAFGHRDLRTLIRQTSFCGISQIVHPNNPRSLEELKHSIEQTVAIIGPETLFRVARKTLKKGECLSSKRWGTFSASVVKLFCKLLLANKN
jgi:hypothetical protein